MYTTQQQQYTSAILLQTAATQQRNERTGTLASLCRQSRLTEVSLQSNQLSAEAFRGSEPLKASGPVRSV